MSRCALSGPRTLFLTAVCLLAVACAATMGSSMNNPQQANESAEARLECDVRSVSHAELVISYSFRNNTAGPLFVFNKLYASVLPGGVLSVDANLVYVDLTAQGWIISKKIATVPTDVDVEKLVVPCVTEVAPGRVVEETVRVPFPLRPYSPYRLIESRLRRSDVLFFEVGYFQGTDASRELARQVETRRGTALLFDPFNPDRQRVLRVGPFKIKDD